MINEQQYNQLRPYRDAILRFKETQHYKGDALVEIDKIRQQLGMSKVCFNCDGDKVNAMMDAVIWIEEYEKQMAHRDEVNR